MGQHNGLSFTSYQGLHGQYIISVPELDLVAVRTGFLRPKKKIDQIDIDVHLTIDWAIQQVGPK